jgi:hypothetical protein
MRIYIRIYIYIRYTIYLDYYHLQDANVKKEIVDRKIQPNRNVYATRKLVDK